MTAKRGLILGLIVAGAAALLGVLWMLPPGDSMRVAHAERTRQKLLLYNGGHVALAPGSLVEQQFTASYPGLSALEVLVYVFPGTPDRTITARLRASCADPTDIFAATVPLPGEGGPYFFTFTLPQPLDDSAGRAYCLLLDAPYAISAEGVVLPLSKGDLYPGGGLTILEPPPEPTPTPPPAPVETAERPYKLYLPLVFSVQPVVEPQIADIGFLLHYNGLPGPTAQTFLARLTANKPYLWGSMWFYVGMALAYVALLGGLVVVAWRSMRGGTP